MQILVDPFTYQLVYLRVRLPKEIVRDMPHLSLPPYMVNPREGGWFMFTDVMEAIEFKLMWM